MTGRAVPEWRGSSPDAKIPTRVRLRVFDRYGGRCYRTNRKIGAGDAWEVEHVVALCNGGLNVESNLAPILAGKPHKEKTAEDVAEKAKVARVRAKHLRIYPASPFKIRSRGFQKRSEWRT